MTKEEFVKRFAVENNITEDLINNLTISPCTHERDLFGECLVDNCFGWYFPPSFMTT